MAHHDVVVMAASAGGIETLREVFGGLPVDLNAAVLVVVHMPPTGGRALPGILGRMTDLPVRAARDGEALEPGRVYVCVADHHLLVGQGHVHVRRGPRENGHRPAADPLFRSAAGYYGPRVVGVVLSGTLSDGTAGLYAVRQQGGTAVVQDPADALYSSMPATALENVGADHVASARDLGPLIGQLVKDDAGTRPEPPGEELRREVALMESDDSVLSEHHPGTPSAWPCPDCSGVLWAINDGPLLRFRCRVGHAWSAESLLHEQGKGVEAALWMALRALEDRAALSQTLAERAEQAGRPISAGRLRQDLGDMSRSLEVLRHLLASGQAAGDPAASDSAGSDSAGSDSAASDSAASDSAVLDDATGEHRP